MPLVEEMVSQEYMLQYLYVADESVQTLTNAQIFTSYNSAIEKANNLLKQFYVEQVTLFAKCGQNDPWAIVSTLSSATKSQHSIKPTHRD